MNEAIFYSWFYGILLYCVMFVLITVILTNDRVHTCFNPRKNYHIWKRFNWFGVWVLTILYWIVFLPFGIMFLIYLLLTVGRK